ncbi:MAG: N-acetylglucosamine-6-phosphate deacetylase [Alphaproteobacteria bacterium]|nr:N-acetylglucosamine-6-phosphate deacetylase [Alphaproteobacteria bacterium]
MVSSGTEFAVIADNVFDGTALRRDCAVVIEGSFILRLVPTAELPPDTPTRRLPEGVWLAPGFIDTQVNGGADVLFNDDPSPEGIAAIATAHQRFGTTALLPTLISDTREKMRAARDAVDAAARVDPRIIGVHYEGPFLSPDKPGVHEKSMICHPEPGDFEMLTSLHNGVTLVTLAPEEVPAGFVAQLSGAGVRVALGHSMATYAQTRAALCEGLSGFTHLFNAMRPLESREPGPVAAALEEPGAWFGMIVDGKHVAPAMLRLALRGVGRPMLVSDAMPPVGGRRENFTLYGRPIAVDGGRCAAADGKLAGSVLDMASAVRNCVRLLDMPLIAALHLASAAPAAFLGIEHWLGHLAPGYRADMAALDPAEVRIRATWVAGAETPADGESAGAPDTARHAAMRPGPG